MSLSEYTFYPTLTPARLVATSNISGIYNNGPYDNGIGATLIGNTFGQLIIDNIDVSIGDRVLLVGQSSNFQNGVYIVFNPGDSRNEYVLQRTFDSDSSGQLKAGMCISIGAGQINAGSIYALIEPLPANIGIDPIIFLSENVQLQLGTAAFKNATDNTKPLVASISGPILANDIATFADNIGTLNDGGTLGTAHNKSVSDNTKPLVASVSGTITANHFPAFADTNGTVKDNGQPFGTAAGKDDTDDTLLTIPSLHGPFLVGDLAVFTSTAGTIGSAHTSLIAGSQNYAGGSVSFTLSVPGVTIFSKPIMSKLTSTNLSFIDTIDVGTDSLFINMNVDPGASSYSYIIFTPT